MVNNSLARWGFLAAAFLLVFEVRATTIRIDIDTSVLGLNLNGQIWDLAFDLIDSDPEPNSVTILNFALTGVGAGLTGDSNYPQTLGNVSGTLPGDVTLDDVPLPPPAVPTSFNEYLDNAKLGTLISFELEITDRQTPGILFPDQFSFLLIDASGTPLRTTDPTGADALFIYTMGNLVPFTSYCPVTPECVFATPVVVAVPEPSALALAMVALLALGCALSAARRAPSPKALIA